MADEKSGSDRDDRSRRREFQGAGWVEMDAALRSSKAVPASSFTETERDDTPHRARITGTLSLKSQSPATKKTRHCG